MAGTAKVGFNVSPAPGDLLNWIVGIYNTLDPTALVTAPQILDAPHAEPVNVLFPNLDPGTYIVVIADTVDDVTFGNIRHNFWIDAATNQILFERRFYLVDGAGAHDPVDGSTNITDPYFDGKTISGLFQEGYRYLKPVTEWQQDGGGVLTYLNDMKTGAPIRNSTDQVWIVEITYAVTSSGGATVESFTDFVTVNADKALGAPDYGLIQLCNAAASLTLTTPFIGTVPAGKGFMVMHDGGGAPNMIWNMQVGELFRFKAADVSTIFIGKGEYIKVLKKGTRLYVVDFSGNWGNIGQIVFDTVQRDNTFIANGASLAQSDCPRLYDWILNKCPVGQKTDLITWDTDPTMQGLYAIDDSTKFIRVPNLLDYTMKALKSIGGADALRPVNVPGGKQAAQVGEFIQNINKGDGYTGGATNVGRFAPGQASHPQGPDPITFNAGKENIVKNIGMMPLVIG